MVADDHIGQKIMDYLCSDGHIFGRTLNKVAEMVSQKNTIVLGVLAVLAISVFLVAEEPKPEMLCHMIGFSYMGYRSIYALVLGTVDECGKMLLSWVILSPCYLTDLILESVSIYWMAKTVFILALLIPPVDLGGEVYVKFAKPAILLCQGKIDRETLTKTHPFILKRIGLDPEKAQNASDSDIKQVNAVAKALAEEIFGPVDPSSVRAQAPAPAAPASKSTASSSSSSGLLPPPPSSTEPKGKKAA